MKLKKMAMIGIPALALALIASGTTRARADLIVNGGFDGTPGLMANNATSTFLAGTGSTLIPDLTGWSSQGGGGSWAAVYAPGTADTTGLAGVTGLHTLWGPNNSGPTDPQYPGNGGPYLPATSPDGGNFVAVDGGFMSGQLSQSVSGLIPGHAYKLGFYYAGAQQGDSAGATTQAWQVSLGGGATQSTPTMNVPSHGFSPWTYQTMTFTANSATEALLFQTVASPAVPPFLLLDGVSLTAVPEPSTMCLGAFALMVGGAAVLRRRARIKAAAL
jgi:hypothetical protein